MILTGEVLVGDVWLSANINQYIHLKLKIAAAKERTNIGELLERLIEENLDGITPQKFTGPTSTCEHDWLKLANDLQTLASEGKTIWICSTCAEITNTYSWQTL